MDREEIVRKMIAHENDVTNHRLGWLNAVQGFLFAAIGFAWEKGGHLIYALALIGVLVAASSAIGLFCSHRAVAKLRKRWNDEWKWEEDTTGLDVVGYWNSKLGRFGPWSTLPTVFIVGWIIVVIIRFTSPPPAPPSYLRSAGIVPSASAWASTSVSTSSPTSRTARSIGNDGGTRRQGFT